MLESGWNSTIKNGSSSQDPILILGGPITFSNPLPSSPFVNAMLLHGEVEETIVPAFSAAFDSTYDGFMKEIQTSGGFVQELDYPNLPDIAKATDSWLPARSHILTPHTELRNMFLIEEKEGAIEVALFVSCDDPQMAACVLSP